MDVVAFSVTSTVKSLSFVSASIPRKRTTKPNISSVYVSPNLIQTNSTHLCLTHCSTRPHIANPDPQKQPSCASNGSTRGLVFDLGVKDSWDSEEIGSPVVKRFLSDEEERWLMWYHGNSSEDSSTGDSIGLAISSNGIHWERGIGSVNSSGDVGVVLKPCQDWWAFDTVSLRPCEVVVMSSAKVRASSSVYWLYYTGFSSERVDAKNGEVMKSLPGLAISQDGRHWARIEGEHHSGALFDVGSNEDWDSLFIAGTHVVFHGNGDLRMFYHSFDQQSGKFCIGLARSRDGINWIKLGKIMGGGKAGEFDEMGVINPCVVRNKRDGNYIMAYEGISCNGERSIGMAMSPDGLKDWRRFCNEPLLKVLENGRWDCKGVGCPCLVQMDGEAEEWRIYYKGIGYGGKTGIGLAIAEGNDFSKFKRWTGFQTCN